MKSYTQKVCYVDIYESDRPNIKIKYMEQNVLNYVVVMDFFYSAMNFKNSILNEILHTKKMFSRNLRIGPTKNVFFHNVYIEFHL